MPGRDLYTFTAALGQPDERVKLWVQTLNPQPSTLIPQPELLTPDP